MSFISYAQNFEDVMLWRALGHIKDGRYVDIGAQSPLVDSISLAFYERGWRGIHVEAVEAYAEELRKCRPEELVIHAAVAAEPGELKFFTFPDTGLSTSESDIAARHVKSGFQVEEATVKAVTLDNVLAHAEGEVHWLKIDVEGGEQAVIQGWRKSPVRPWIVLVESTRPLTQTAAHEDWEPLILEKGYIYAYFDGLNRYYVSEAHNELISAFSVGPNIFDDFTLNGTASSPFCAAVNERLRDVEAERDAERFSIDAFDRTLKQKEEQLDQWKARAAELSSSAEELQGLANALQEQSVEAQRLADARQLQIDGISQQLRIAQVDLAGAVQMADVERRTRMVELNARRAMQSLLDSELHAKKIQLAQILGSRSWRITRPLRVLARLGRNGPDELMAAFIARLAEGRVRRLALRGLRLSPRLRERVLQRMAPTYSDHAQEVPASPPPKPVALSQRTEFALKAMDESRTSPKDKAGNR